MDEKHASTMIPMVYHNGAVLPAAHAHLSIADEGVLYGLGFFETFRTSGGRPHHWRYNRARLEQSSARAGLALPSTFLALDESRLHRTVQQLLRGNGYHDAVFRYTVTAGCGGRMSEFLVSRPPPSAAPAEGISLRVLKLRRDSGEWIPRPKSLNCLNAILGTRELEKRSAATADEGLFLSRNGELVVETSRQNIIWVTRGRFQTTDDVSGRVAGTCLAWIEENGLSVEMVQAKIPDLLTAEAIVCVSSVRGITPVLELWDESDKTRLGRFESARHPLVIELASRWNAALESTAAT